MALVHLLTAAPPPTSPGLDFRFMLTLMQRHQARDRFGQHTLVNDPAAADVILFCEHHHNDGGSGPFLARIVKHPVYRAHSEKTFIFCGLDQPVPFVRGLYPSIEKPWYRRDWVRGSSYLIKKNELIEAADRSTTTKWLGSFVGSVTNVPLRQRLMMLKDDRLLLVDNNDAFIAAVKRGDKDGVDGFKRQYVQSVVESKFILCPRGAGASSIRLFEAMELGRVPVILSDAWVEPEGPDWSRCSIRIAERDLPKIGQILRAQEGGWREMAAAARETWLEWFSDDVFYHRAIESCLDLKRTTTPRTQRMMSRWNRMQLLRRVNFRRWIQSVRADRKAAISAATSAAGS